MTDGARPYRRGLMALLALAVTFAGGVWWGRASAPPREPPPIDGLWWPAGPRLDAFELRDEANRPFTASALDGHWTLLFFGFTHCPDICPTTLATLKQAHASLQDQPSLAQRLQVVFVSVDAARDTPELLAAYVRHFNPSFRGITGPMEALHFLTRPLGADYARVSTGQSGEYWFDHSAAVFLVAPDRRVVAAFEPPLVGGEIAAKTRAIQQFLE